MWHEAFSSDRRLAIRIKALAGQFQGGYNSKSVCLSDPNQAEEGHHEPIFPLLHTFALLIFQERQVFCLEERLRLSVELRKHVFCVQPSSNP